MNMSNQDSHESLANLRFWLDSIHHDLTQLYIAMNYAGFYLLLAVYVKELDVNSIFGDVLHQMENSDKAFQDDIQTTHETVIADLDAVWESLRKNSYNVTSLMTLDLFA